LRRAGLRGHLGDYSGRYSFLRLALDHPKRCDRLVLACTFAFNMATPREWLEGHLLPPLLDILGTRGLAKLVVSQATRQLGRERADWLAGLMADQDRKLMSAAWRETMAFDSRRRLAGIACPARPRRLQRSRGTDPPRQDAAQGHPWVSAGHYRWRRPRAHLDPSRRVPAGHGRVPRSLIRPGPAAAPIPDVAARLTWACWPGSRMTGPLTSGVAGGEVFGLCKAECTTPYSIRTFGCS
jgi:hypothetical protein